MTQPWSEEALSLQLGTRWRLENSTGGNWSRLLGNLTSSSALQQDLSILDNRLEKYSVSHALTDSPSPLQAPFSQGEAVFP